MGWGGRLVCPTRGSAGCADPERSGHVTGFPCLSQLDRQAKLTFVKAHLSFRTQTFQNLSLLYSF